MLAMVMQACGGSESKTVDGTVDGYVLDLNTPDFAALQQPGGAVKVTANGEKLLVIRLDASTCMAVSAVCTHAGCDLGVPASGVITCRCHGSRFDTSGHVLKGPATEDLAQVPTVLDGNRLTLKV